MASKEDRNNLRGEQEPEGAHLRGKSGETESSSRERREREKLYRVQFASEMVGSGMQIGDEEKRRNSTRFFQKYKLSGHESLGTSAADLI